MNKNPAQTYEQQTAPSFPHVTVHIPENKRNKQQPAGLQQTILTLNKIQNIHFFHKPSQSCTVCLSLS